MSPTSISVPAAPQRDPTQRFSDRVENYAKYRPGYPPEMYDLLAQRAWLKPGDRIADLGSGTGLLSKIFIDRGHTVLAVEPNAPMRFSAENIFAGEPRFISIAGRAEATTLEASSVDFLVAGQAFHWFDPVATKDEIHRILKPNKGVTLIWNRRDTSDGFQHAYEQLLERYGTDFKQVDQRRITDDAINEFFAPNRVSKATLPNKQFLDAEGLRGRLLSSSYAPTPEQPSFRPMLNALDELFDKFKRNGSVTFLYRTEIYYGII